MLSPIRQYTTVHQVRPASVRPARWLAFLAVGMLLQAAPAGCAGQFLTTLGQDLSKGLGEGITNLAQALVLNLFT